MALRASIILIVGIIIKTCILQAEGLSFHVPGVYSIGEMQSGNPGLLNQNDFRRRHRSNNQVKLFNGKAAKIEDYPFLVNFNYLDKPLPVGIGSIIGAVWVLTAAHCFINDHLNITDSEIQQGRVSTHSNSTLWMDHTTVVRKVVAYYIQQGYNVKTRDFDISVVKVDKVFNGLYEQPVSLASPNYYYQSFSTARILSWSNETGNPEYTKLAKVKVTLSPQKRCKHLSYRGKTKVTSRQVCASGWNQGACYLDGPLYQRRKIIGILASDTCDKYPTSMNIFTRISEFSGFILRTMNQ